jgi:DNA-binding NtrC family response regulator
LTLFASKYDRPQRTIATDTMKELCNYDWPGNVRALRHAAERAVIMADGDQYQLEDSALPARSHGPLPSSPPAGMNLEQIEKQTIERALRVHHFNISLAATELGLSRGALYRRMEKHGL